MADVRGKDTNPEIIVRPALHAASFRFRLHRKGLPGRPDIVFPRNRTVVFVNGCFWHKHNCKYFVWPKTRAEFWREKIVANVARDKRNRAALRRIGWRVKTVWECGTTSHELAMLAHVIRDGQSVVE